MNMSNIKIMTDSASDISYEDEERYSISVIPFPITLGGKTYTSRVDFDNKQFYDLLAQSSDMPMTSQITPFQFMEIYLEQARAGVSDLILVLINSKGSATYDCSLQAIAMFKDEHPEFSDFRIHSFDGMGYNAIYGSVVVQSARMREAGASVEEICAYIRGILPRREIYFGIYDLKYAARSGRIPTAAAFLGNKLNLKPVMKIFDREISTAFKCRGEKNLVKKIMELSLEDMEPGSPYELIYGSDRECLEELRSLMTEALGYGPAAEYQIGAAVAANAGPRVVGAAFTRR